MLRLEETNPNLDLRAQMLFRRLSREYNRETHEKLLKILSDPLHWARLAGLGDFTLCEGLEIDGSIKLPEGQKVGISLKDLCQSGLGIYGMKGSGKTGFTIHIAASILHFGFGKGVLIFDPKSLSYTGLCRSFTDLIYISNHQLELNIFERPKGIPTYEWSRLLSYMVAGLGMIQGMGKLQTILNALYENVKNPNMGDFLRYLDEAKAKKGKVKGQWLDTVIGIFERITSGLGQTVNGRDNRQLEYLRDNSFIIGTRSALDMDDFFVSFISTWLCASFYGSGNVGGEFNKLFVGEESQLSVGVEKGRHPATGGATAFERINNVWQREVGMPIILSAQNYSKMSEDYRSGAAKATFRSGEEDVKLMGHLGCYKMFVPHLLDREFILKRNHRITSPMLCRTIDIPGEWLKPVSDDELKKMMSGHWRRLASLHNPVVQSGFSQDSAKSGEEKPAENGRVVGEVESGEPGGREKDKWSELETKHRAFIISYAMKFPKTTLTGFYDDWASSYSRKTSTKLSRNTVIKIKNELASKGYIEVKDVESKGQGQNKVLILTEKTKDFLEDTLSDRQFHKKLRGDDLHYYYAHHLVEQLKRKYPDAKIKMGDTKTLPGGEVDVVMVDVKGKAHGFEVALETRNIRDREHIQKRLNVLDSLTILVKEADVSKVKKSISDMDVDVVSLKSCLVIRKESKEKLKG